MTSPNTNPVFTDTPNFGRVSIAAANAGRDGTGTVGTAFTAGLKGSRVHRIRINAIVTTTTGLIRIFIHDGAAYFLYKEIIVTAVTPSATTPAFSSVLELPGELALQLPTGFTIRVSTEKAETFHVFVEGGDF